MRKHNDKAVTLSRQNMMKRLKQGIGVLGLSLLMATTAYAAPISGKVFLDYDDTGSSANAPLSGITVEVLDNSGAPLTTPLTMTTGADGSYSFNSASIQTSHTYKIKASTTTTGEEITLPVNIPTSAGVSGQNIFLKGLGGDIDITIKSTKPTMMNLKDIPVSFSASNLASMSLISNATGKVTLKNSLKGIAYTVKVDPDDVLTNTSNGGGKSFALWSANNGTTEVFDSKFTLTMSGTNKSGSFEARERNEWGMDGLVAVDQDENGIYGFGVDTPSAGVQVGLYYQGSNDLVIGQPIQTTDAKGGYHFEKLPLGNYTTKVIGLAAPWQFIPGETAAQNVNVALLTGQPAAHKYLIQVSNSDTTLPGISGSIFALSNTQKAPRGPDSGQAGVATPVTGAVRFSVPVMLQVHNGTSWTTISTINSKTDGSYSFRGLASGKDYKVVINDAGINSGQYIFVNDADGKSTDTSAASLSSHKGKVTLSNNSKENIAPREIVFPTLSSTKMMQNFWYSAIRPNIMFVRSFMQTTNGVQAWNAVINGVTSHSMAGYFTFSVYEEDGVTPATKSDGTLLPSYTYKSLAQPYSINGWTQVSTDHSGVYVVKPTTTAPEITLTPSIGVVPTNNLSGDSNGTVSFRAIPVQNHTIEGTVFYDKNNDNLHDAGDVDVFAASIDLYRDNPSGLTLVSRIGTNTQGKYKFTDIPSGTYVLITNGFTSNSNFNASDFILSGNADGNTTNKLHLTLSGGGVTTGKDYWYQTTATELVIRGAVYLDTFRGDGLLTTSGVNNSHDKPFWGVDVLLCKTSTESDCHVGAPPSVLIATKHTDNTGSFEFKASTVVSGIQPNTDYIVKAVRNDSKAIVTGNIKEFYKIKFDTPTDAPIKANFFMKGNANGRYHGNIVNDYNGDVIYAGGGSIETGVGDVDIYYYDTSSSTYKYWFKSGHFWHDFDIRSLPKGKYKIVHIAGGAQYAVSDTSPTLAGDSIVEFEIAANGSITDGQPNTNRNFYVASSLGISEGVSGKIYLDISGSGIKDDSSILVPAAELAGAVVDGYFSPRFYNNYSVGENTVLGDPNFTDSGLSTTNYFAHTASNSLKPAGNLRVTNYLLHLKNLPVKYEIIANSSQAKASYFSTAIKNDLSYMQVTPATTGAPDQYYLVKMVTPSTIEGQLYYDLNGDGSYSSGVDEPVSGVRVELYDGATLISYTKSDGNGNYKFSNIFNSNYTVKVTTTGLDTTKYEPPATTTAMGLNITSAVQNINNVDFIYNKIGDAAVSGYVMLDVNNNGVVDIKFDKTGDIALSGVTVELYKTAVAGAPFKSTITNAKGFYNFGKLDLDTDYFVKVITPANHGVIANASSNTNDILNKISIGSTASTVSNQFFLLAGASNNAPSGGNGGAGATNSGISGFTYLDASTTPVGSAVLISLVDDSTGTEIARQYTNATTGKYQFFNLPNGTYKVVVSSSVAGKALSSNSASSTPFDTIASIALTGSGKHNNNFFYKTSSIKGIEGKVYVDFANDNTSITFDANDHPLAGAKVELYEGLAASGSAINSTTTGTSGEYKFPNLLPGVDYSVKIDMTSIADYEFKRSNSGNAVATDVIIDVVALPVLGKDNNNYLVKGKLKIEGDVWIDANNDKAKTTAEMVAGASVELQYKAPGTAAFSTLKTTTTVSTAGSEGRYSFDTLPKGTDYKVIVDSNDTNLAGVGAELYPVADIAGNADNFTHLALAADETTSSSAYRYIGEISGHLDLEVDGDHVYTVGVDDDFSGVKVTITNGADVRSVITGSDGQFSFKNLPYGTWTLGEDAIQPLTKWSNFKLDHLDDGTGSHIVASIPHSINIVLDSTNKKRTGIDVGYAGSAIVSGYVVIDGDPSSGSTAVVGTDVPVVGVTVTLNGGGATPRTTTTDGNGFYKFENLVPHSYALSVDTTHTDLTGYVLSFAPHGSTTASCTESVVDVDNNLTQQDFGFKGNLTFSGKVTRDIDADGTLSTIDEPFVTAQTVTLTRTDSTPNITKTTTTSTTDGTYSFSDIGPGTWAASITSLTAAEAPNYAASYAPAAVTVTTANVTGQNFGFKGNKSYSGVLVYDNDIDGTNSAGDTPVQAAINVKLSGPSGFVTRTVALNTTTGAYSISDLDGSFANYTVSVDTSQTNFPAGWSPSFAPYSTANATSVTLDWSQALTGNDFGFRGDGAIGGFVFRDMNPAAGNTAKAAYDQAFTTPVTVTLTNVTTGTTRTTVTSSIGEYNFAGVGPDTWTVHVATAPANHVFSYAEVAGGTLAGNVVTKTTTASAHTVTGLNLAYKGDKTLSGKVVLDVSPDTAVVDALDVAQNGVNVVIYDNNNPSNTRTVATSATGDFTVANVTYADWRVKVDPAATASLAGHEISFRPADNATTGVMATSTTDFEAKIDLTEATLGTATLSGKNYGFKSNGAIKGKIYRDLGGLGTPNTVDDMLAGVKVKAVNNVLGITRYSNVTLADGEFAIEGIPMGIWDVTIDSLPSTDYGYSYVKDLYGDTTATVTNGVQLDINPTAARIAAKTAEVSFGIKANARLGGQIVVDVDDTTPTIANVDAADLAVDSVKPGYVADLYVGAVKVATATVTSGNYAFTNLSDNVLYRVEVVQPDANYMDSFNVAGTGANATASNPQNTANKMSHEYTFATTNAQASGANFGWKGVGGIDGNVFWDKDDNGVYNNVIDSDIGAPLTVTLQHANATIPSIVRNVAAGNVAYAATGLLPGNWTITIGGVPATYKASFDPDDAHNISSLPASKGRAVVNIGAATLNNQHFGYIKGGAMIGEIKHDASATGSYNPADVGITPIDVALLDTANNPIMDSANNPIVAQTNASGEFSFRNLDPTMDYHVQVKFGTAGTGDLTNMEPSYDSQVGTISLIPPVSTTVDTVNETHTLLAGIMAAANNEITVGNLYFGYRAAGGDLTIHKKAMKDNVVVGDIVPYTITIENNKATTAFNVLIKDLIPAGFKYVNGSARLDGQKIAGPSGGRPIFFGPMDIGGQGSSVMPSKRTLTYMLVVGAGVTQGEYKNVAIALDRNGNDASNVSEATVTVTSDPLFDNALIFGKVFVDNNGNGIQDEGEEGLGGVKLVTVRGEIITTDQYGRYHLAGVNGGRWERGTNFILKLDPRSLPKGYKVIGRNPLVVRLSPGLPSKVDFKVQQEK